jgi:pimeloyl-ACP methyl ester carboxylesterase
VNREDKMALEHGTFAVDDVSLHYVKAGAGPLLLCIHGFPQHWYVFRHVIAAFACDHTVVAVDLRGFNLSTRPAKLRDNGPWVCADDMAALVRHLGFATCVAIGHDLGGPVCYSMALHWPQMLSRLVVLQAAHPGTLDRELHHNPEQIASGGHWLALRRADSAERLRENDCALLKTIFDGNDFFTAVDREIYLESWRRTGAVEGMVAWYRKEGVGPAEGLTPASGNYAREAGSLIIDHPTLVIYGDADKHLRRGLWQGLDAWVPDLELHRIEGAGHWILEERPARINALIRSFLARTSGAASAVMTPVSADA